MAAHVGKETEFESLGKTWRAQRFERGSCHDAFVEWARTKLPDPRVTARKEIEELALASLEISERQDLKPAQKQALLAANLRQQHHAAEYSLDMQNDWLAIESPQVRKMIGTDEGGVQIMRIMLTKHHPDIDEEMAAAIVEELGPVKLSEILERVSGTVPPKAPAPARGKSSSQKESHSPGETSTKNLLPVTPD